MGFGTWNGIKRLDGQRFDTYKSSPGDKSYLKSHRIDQMMGDEFLELGYRGTIKWFTASTNAQCKRVAFAQYSG